MDGVARLFAHIVLCSSRLVSQAIRNMSGYKADSPSLYIFLSQNWQWENHHPTAFKHMYIQVAFPYRYKRTDEPLTKSMI